MIGLLVRGDPSFSPLRFLAYLGVMAALCLKSLAPEGGQAFAPAEGGPAMEPLRLGRPVAELYPQLRQAGLPWYLRRAGAKAVVTGDGSSTLSFDIDADGHKIGRYVERLERIDADRSKLWLSFEAADAKAVAALAAPVRSRLPDEDLMRAILKEHIRSELSDDKFDLDVLANNRFAALGIVSGYLGRNFLCPQPQSDDFPLCEADQEAATVRRAYIAAGRR